MKLRHSRANLGNKWQGSNRCSRCAGVGVIRTLNPEQRRREFSPEKRYRFAGSRNSRVARTPFARRDCKRLEYEQWRPQGLVDRRIGSGAPHSKRLFKRCSRYNTSWRHKRSGGYSLFKISPARCCRARPQPAGFTSGDFEEIKGSSPRCVVDSSSATAMCRKCGECLRHGADHSNQRVRPAEVVSAIPALCRLRAVRNGGSQEWGKPWQLAQSR